MNPRILVVDDQERMAQVIATALRSAGYECDIALDGDRALAMLADRAYDVIVTDWKMPEVDGMELLRRMKRERSTLPVIFITAYGSVASAVAAMRAGAFDYVTKPFDNDELRATVGRALEMTQLRRENSYLRQIATGRYSPDQIIAESPRSRELIDLVRRAAPSHASVLIEGESGTGKELVARMLHYYSERVGGPFIAVNCKAFAAGVLESELFGHEKGSFTGAVAAHPGCFERADGGTLFLDEIAEVGGDFQAKLLRVLQGGEVLRVGGSTPRKINVRVVAATNRALRDELAAGRFREDLYFRLNIIPVRTIPLRERPEDIIPLARHFLAIHSAEANRRAEFLPETEAAMVKHTWPGNVRELENVVERAAVLSTSDQISLRDLMLDQPIAGSAAAFKGTLQDSIDELVRTRIAAALEASNGNRAEAARALGIDRATLWRLIKRLNS
jgi:two-component system NtrC family response regulator